MRVHWVAGTILKVHYVSCLISLDTVLEVVNLRTRNRVSFCLRSRERWGGEAG